VELEINVVEVADGRAYREAISVLAAPIMMLVRQLEDSICATFVEELVATVALPCACPAPPESQRLKSK